MNKVGAGRGVGRANGIYVDRARGISMPVRSFAFRCDRTTEHMLCDTREIADVCTKEALDRWLNERWEVRYYKGVTRNGEVICDNAPDWLWIDLHSSSVVWNDDWNDADIVVYLP